MVSNKRGQAALEFLTTYGWAFMVILVMIGALAYFGVLNPQNLIPDQCAITSGFTCRDTQLTAPSAPAASDGVLQMNVVSNMGEQIDITNFNAEKPGAAPLVPAGVLAAAGVADGQAFSLSINDIPGVWGWTTNSKQKVSFSFDYTKTGVVGGFPHRVTGTITATVR